MKKYQIKRRLERLESKEAYKYLGILEADTTKQVEMKEKISQENKKAIRYQTILQKPFQWNEYLGCIPH